MTGLFENDKRAIATAVVVVLVALMFFATISYYNHTEAQRSVACSQSGGSYTDEGGCEDR